MRGSSVSELLATQAWGPERGCARTHTQAAHAYNYWTEEMGGSACLVQLESSKFNERLCFKKQDEKQLGKTSDVSLLDSHACVYMLECVSENTYRTGVERGKGRNDEKEEELQWLVFNLWVLCDDSFSIFLSKQRSFLCLPYSFNFYFLHLYKSVNFKPPSIPFGDALRMFSRA